MKTNQTIRKIKNYSKIPVLAMAVLLTGCEKEDDPVDPVNAGNDVPSEEHDHEVITDVELIFTNDADPSDVVIASAVDPDDIIDNLVEDIKATLKEEIRLWK